jgi:hypothetical protein
MDHILFPCIYPSGREYNYDSYTTTRVYIGGIYIILLFYFLQLLLWLLLSV